MFGARVRLFGQTSAAVQKAVLTNTDGDLLVALNATQAAYLDGLEGKLDTLATKLDSVIAAVDGLEASVDGLEAQLTALSGQLPAALSAGGNLKVEVITP